MNKLMTKQEKYRAYVKDKMLKGLCIQCGEKAVTSRYCEYHRLQRIAKIKAWKERNPERVKTWAKKTYGKRTQAAKDKFRAYQKEYYRKNKELIIEKQRVYRKKKKEQS